MTTTERKGPSPLYTSATVAVRKAKAVQQMGKDKDGAYRATGRLDGKTVA